MVAALMTLFTGVGSFALLVFASWCVGEGGEILGAKFDASIVGGLLIAWLNTAPEAIFFLQALNSGNPRFAMGAVSGSAIVVCTVAVGACVWIGASARSSGDFTLLPSVKRQCQVLAVSVVFPIVSAAYGYSALWGAAAFAFYTAFLVYTMYGSRDVAGGDAKKVDIESGVAASPNGRDSPFVEEPDAEEELDDEHANASTYKGIAFLAVGGTLIFVCSSPFIDAVVEASALLRVSPTLLAFFLAPVASEMPEILEAISLSRKGHVQAINVAYSNLIGGTITKTTLMVGIFSFFGVWKGFVWEQPNYSFSLVLLGVCALVAALVGSLPRKLRAWHGLALWALFLTVALIQYFLNGTFVGDVVPDVLPVNIK